MKRIVFPIIILFAIAISKLKAQSSIQYIEHRQNINIPACCASNISSLKNKEEFNQRDKLIFKSSEKETSDSLFFKTPKKSEGSSLKFNNTRYKLGFISGYGNQKNLSVSYSYEIAFFQFQYYYSLLKKKTWGFEVLLQPQYNVTKYKSNFYGEQEQKGYEFGLNLGLLVRKNIVKDVLSSYILISSGPHYVSGTPERQASGFIFSDNFFAGVSFKVFKSFYLDIRGGFRHISNAGLKNPNSGINNLVINKGFFLAF